MTRATARPGEYITYIEQHDPAAGAALYVRQHSEGFQANIAGTDFQEFRTAAWCDGWLDANDLGTLAPLE